MLINKTILKGTGALIEAIYKRATLTKRCKLRFIAREPKASG
jgi:hypothetical protein